ncbi:MAG: ABC transporter substrate-binding protein [Capsulimonadaceae bacterium]
MRKNEQFLSIPRLMAAAVVVALVGGCANQAPAPGTGSSPGAGAGTGQTSQTPPPGSIVIGEYGSMTGAQSTFGVSTDNGIRLAVEDANKAGGVFTHPLFVVLHDDEGKPDATQTVANLLATEDHPTAVLGEVASGRSTIAAPVFNTAKIPMISPSSTNPKVTQIGPYIFRVCFLDSFQGKAAAEFAVKNLHAKTAAVFTDPTNQYSIGLGGFFSKAFTDLGGKVVADKHYTSTDASFQSQLSEIKAANPDILYVPGYYDTVGPIAKQARSVGLTVPLMGGDGWDSDKLVAGAGGPGGAMEGCYLTDHYSVNSQAPAIKAFVAEYNTAYKGNPDSLAALGYDAAGVLIAAMKSLGAPADGNYDSDAYRIKLRDAIAKTKNYPGITGTISLGPDRNAVKPATILQVKGDQFVQVGTINP